MAEVNNYKGIVIDTVEKSYSDKNIKNTDYYTLFLVE